MYSFDVAQARNFFAASGDFDVFGIASAHDHNQCEPFGVTLDRCGGEVDLVDHRAGATCCRAARAPTVASIHIAHLPVDISVRFSLKPFELAPGGPSFLSRST